MADIPNNWEKQNVSVERGSEKRLFPINRKRISLAALIGFLLVTDISCAPKSLTDVGKPLDRVSRKIEEFGSVTMSSPLLSRPDPNLAFDLKRSSETYFNEAKSGVQGGAASFRQVAQYLSVGAAAQYDPMQFAAAAEALRQYQSSRSQYDQAQQLRVEAATIEYEAALEAANALDDPQERAAQIATAKRAYAHALAAPDAAPTFPTANDGSTPDPATGLAKPPSEARGRLHDEGNAKDALALLPSDFSPTISNRKAIATAAGDKAVEAVFRVLGNPGEAQRFKGKSILFGAAAVSVDPGWRTQRGFAADLSIRTELVPQDARLEVLELLIEGDSLPDPLRARLADDNGIPRPAAIAGTPVAAAGSAIPKVFALGSKAWERVNPLVAAVSPLTDTQSLDLTSSNRDVMELSLALSFALRQQGLAGQAEVVEQYVNSLQRDVRTRTAAGVANSYSASGGVFGYQIGPEFRGLADPADGDEAGDVLDRQSFPVLIAIGLDQRDMRPQLEWTNGSLKALEPKIQFIQTSRWMPLERPWYSFGGRFGARFSETDRLDLSRRLADDKYTKAVAALPEGTGGLAKTREYIFKHLAFGSVGFQDLPLEFVVPSTKAPVPKIPQSIRVIPDRISLKKSAAGAITPATASFAIVGSHLAVVKPAGISVTVGNAAIIGSPRAVNGAIVVDLRVSGDGSPVILELEIDGKAANLPDDIKMLASPISVMTTK